MRFIYTKAFAIFSLCLVALLILVFLQVKGWLDPVRAMILEAPRPIALLAESVVRPVQNFAKTVYQLKGVIKENASLQAQVAQLQQQLVNADQQARENEALRKELGFVQNSSLQLLPCTVLSQNPFGLTNSLVLSCGTDQGLAAGQAIESQGYLVGKITYVGKGSSTALLATAADFSTDAQVSQSGQVAIVKGSFGSGLILDQVPQSGQLQPGWQIATAGINPQIPKGLLIGQVGDLLSSDNDLFKRASVVSPIDFSNLEFVFAVKS